jgi:hypothetical protein
MIIGFFLQILYAFLTWVIGFLWVAHLPSAVASGFVTVVSYINLFTFIFPVQHLFIILSISVVVESVILVWHFGWKIIHLLRGH